MMLQVGASSIFRIRTLGRENVPLEGPAILASNHQSFLDPPFCTLGLNREVDFVARDSLFKNPLFAKLIRSLNAFPIQRGTADIQAVKTIIERLRDGRAIILFPEGTRTLDGRIGSIKAGFELIARRAKAPVVPVVIDGAFEAWPRTLPLPLPGQIRVMYDKPIMPDEIRQLGREGFSERMTQRYRTMQAQLRQQYGRRPYEYEK